ncbi:unnamed protein product [Rotaria sordida]|uniref:Uncharacterized protein n=1 Tax=Rotaria sordida TaxID=392033 RepID=A0A819NQD4_9BILA|nr:unnamed protein product [Rotaria sordida]CAF4003013.1 unnamed protein product [Rotaria sordida]
MSSSTSAVASGKTSSKSVGRPALKNLTRSRVPRAGIIGFSLGAVSALMYKFLISDRHKREISTFYKNYDPERDYARMKAAGVFKSLESQERPEWLNDYEKELDDAIASLQIRSGSKW